VNVVADTSPISYLILIGEAGLFETLYGGVVVPGAVERELTHPSAPDAVATWVKSPPDWLSVMPSPGLQELSNDEAFQRLDVGEQAAIALAVQDDARLLVIDEQEGRRVARSYDLQITGTIGILGAAVRAERATAPDLVRRLQETSFRASVELYEWLLEQEP